jgi:cation diffusion facilitator CzcD-associated flavoprotein CzcO
MAGLAIGIVGGGVGGMAAAIALRAEGHDEPLVRKIVRAVGGTGFNLNLFPNVACSMAFFRVLLGAVAAAAELRHGGPLRRLWALAAARTRLRGAQLLVLRKVVPKLHSGRPAWRSRGSA